MTKNSYYDQFNKEYDLSNKNHAAVITFPEGMTKAECDDILRRMFKAGYCKAAYDGNAPTCQAFDPDFSSPTLYFP